MHDAVRTAIYWMRDSWERRGSTSGRCCFPNVIKPWFSTGQREYLQLSPFRGKTVHAKWVHNLRISITKSKRNWELQRQGRNFPSSPERHLPAKKAGPDPANICLHSGWRPPHEHNSTHLRVFLQISAAKWTQPAECQQRWLGSLSLPPDDSSPTDRTVGNRDLNNSWVTFILGAHITCYFSGDQTSLFVEEVQKPPGCHPAFLTFSSYEGVDQRRRSKRRGICIVI